MDISEINKHLLQFRIIAFNSKNVDDFIKSARKVKNVPYEVSTHFKLRYRRENDIRQACQLFINETKDMQKNNPDIFRHWEGKNAYKKFLINEQKASEALDLQCLYDLNNREL